MLLVIISQSQDKSWAGVATDSFQWRAPFQADGSPSALDGACFYSNGLWLAISSLCSQSGNNKKIVSSERIPCYHVEKQDTIRDCSNFLAFWHKWIKLFIWKKNKTKWIKSRYTAKMRYNKTVRRCRKINKRGRRPSGTYIPLEAAGDCNITGNVRSNSAQNEGRGLE